VGRGALEALVRWLRSGRAPEPPAGADAERLVEVAEQQRVAPLLYAAVAERDDWPAAAVARLRDRHHASFAQGVRQLALVGAVGEAFERANVRALAMKGAALAESVYDSVADRPMADVDVLVLAGWDDAVAALKGLGLGELDRADHAWSFRDPEGGILELHHSVTSCPGLFPLDAEGLWRRSRTGTGQVRRRPGPEDLLVQLALHAAFQHALGLSLVQYLDFKRLASAESLDPGRLRSAAEAAAAGPAVAASLAVADALLGLELDPGIRDWARDRRPTALAGWLTSSLEDPSGFVEAGPRPLVRVRWGLSQGRRLQLVLRTLSPPSPGRRPSAVRRLLQALARTAGLAWRWLILR
jgi:hypothetical protein